MESRRGWLLPPLLQARLLPWVSQAHPGQTASPSHCLVLPLPPPLPLHPRPQRRPPLRQPPWARQPRLPAWWACRSDLRVGRLGKIQLELVSGLLNQMSCMTGGAGHLPALSLPRHPTAPHTLSPSRSSRSAAPPVAAACAVAVPGADPAADGRPTEGPEAAGEAAPSSALSVPASQAGRSRASSASSPCNKG